MLEGKKKVNCRLIVFIISVLLIWFGASCKERTSDSASKTAKSSAVENVKDVENQNVAPTKPPDVENPNNIPATKPASKTSLKDIINTKSRRGWGPVFELWYGQPARDFVLPDLEGKEHKLSDYHGKDVIVVFWATWCIPCHYEIPHLIALRNLISKDELAILAISNEDPRVVRRFMSKAKINYTVLSNHKSYLPAPFRLVTGIPTSFFIDKEGNIKIITQGTLLLADTKAILEAD
jgi:peroxiredoxin